MAIRENLQKLRQPCFHRVFFRPFFDYTNHFFVITIFFRWSALSVIEFTAGTGTSVARTHTPKISQKFNYIHCFYSFVCLFVCLFAYPHCSAIALAILGKGLALFFALSIRIPIQVRLNTLHPLFTPLTDVMIEGGVISTSGSTIEVTTGANPIMLFTWAKDFFKLPNPCGFGQQFPFPVTNHWLHLPLQALSFTLLFFRRFWQRHPVSDDAILCILQAHDSPPLEIAFFNSSASISLIFLPPNSFLLRSLGKRKILRCYYRSSSMFSCIRNRLFLKVLSRLSSVLVGSRFAHQRRRGAFRRLLGIRFASTS